MRGYKTDRGQARAIASNRERLDSLPQCVKSVRSGAAEADTLFILAYQQLRADNFSFNELCRTVRQASLAGSFLAAKLLDCKRDDSSEARL